MTFAQPLARPRHSRLRSRYDGDMHDPDPVKLGLFASRVGSVCDEMGARLMRSAFSPNIRDRLDFSCAVFDAEGGLMAQAAHIPVHLGSMAFAMRDIVQAVDWADGDQLILNDPYLGGTHLPDVTLIAPVFVGTELVGFVANRAHYADIGSAAPGSMPLTDRLDQEGLLIRPQRIVTGGVISPAAIAGIAQATRNPRDTLGDINAQIGCNLWGRDRLQALVSTQGVAPFRAATRALNDYAERLTRGLLASLPAGNYTFEDYLEDDGFGNEDLPIRVQLRIDAEGAVVDFTGTAQQTRGNVNCPLAVTAAGVWYAFRCLLPAHTPACAGAFRPLELRVPSGSVLNANYPAAVAVGNVETSMRVVDVVLGALAQALTDRIPAASQGTMNNMAFGADDWGYYETVGGGMGGGPDQRGLTAVQSHMTNTRNTPVEVLEMRYPVRVRRYAERRGSGGTGLHPGGDGIVRELEFLKPAVVTFLTERRRRAPWGLRGGQPGRSGRNALNGLPLPAKCEVAVRAGDLITLETPGGGGWGSPPTETGPT